MIYPISRSALLLTIVTASLTVASPAAYSSTCNGMAATVILANGELPTSGADIIIGTETADVINAMGGDDVICSLGGADIVNGGKGDDWIDSGTDNDQILGGDGADTLDGNIGDDTISGGPGNDTIQGGDGNDLLFGNSGADTINGDNGVDKISGGSGDDLINTGSGATVDTGVIVDGGAGNDTITGGPDEDEIRGSSGNDIIHGGDGADRLFGGGGMDKIHGQNGADFIRGNANHDQLYGEEDIDNINGGTGNDLIMGGPAADSLWGSTGNDELHGHSGNDFLNGGGGNDSLFGSGGIDTILGGGSNDMMDGGPDSPDTCDGEAGEDIATIECEIANSSNGISPDLANYSLVFKDEFNDLSLNPQKWQTGLLWGPYIPINGEEQLYVDTLGINSGFSHSPFEFTGNSIKITATPTSDTLQPPPRPPENDPAWDPFPEYRFNGPSEEGPGYLPENVNYLSGILTSYDAFKMTHGYVEIRAKFPAGRGLWPAFWLLNTHYIEDSPEIDVVEFLGQNTDRVYHTYHYFDISNNWQKVSTPTYETHGPDWTQSFHRYGMSWTPNEIVWYVDGVEKQRIVEGDIVEYYFNGQPVQTPLKISRQAMYLLLNLAVGGVWPGTPDASTIFPSSFEIDYVRAYKRKLPDTLDLANDYQLMFYDEFSGPTLDTQKWNTRYLWGPYAIINNEEQYYVDTNGIDSDKNYSPFSFNSEGATDFLTITANTSANSGSQLPPAAIPSNNDPIWTQNPEFQQGPFPTPREYTSGLITSYDSFKFVNGYAEIRARVPAGDGLWPAFWLLNAYYVGPLPEIDIMEIIGETPEIAYHTYHRSGINGVQLQTQFTTNSGSSTSGYSDGFHTFGVRWEPGKITWYVDGEAQHTYLETGDNKNDAYQLMYVLANLAVGGNFNSKPLDTSNLPAKFDIDYIRIYQEKDLP